MNLLGLLQCLDDPMMRSVFQRKCMRYGARNFCPLRDELREYNKSRRQKSEIKHDVGNDRFSGHYPIKTQPT